jgi:hypothetical protein
LILALGQGTSCGPGRDPGDGAGEVGSRVAVSSPSTTDPRSPGGADDTSSGAGAPTAETTGPGEAEVVLGDWLGAYEWVEAVEGLSGVNQVLGHVLVLEAVSDDGALATGRLDQNGFQTARTLTVRATVDGAELAVEAAEAGDLFSDGQVLFRLGGTPDAPRTTLEALPSLVEDRPPVGVYFQPVARPPAAVPDELWAVEAGVFDLVRIDRVTGRVLERIAGFGAEAALVGEGGGQALQTVEVAGDGRLWVTDCCEPAVGNLYVLRPGMSRSVDSAEFRWYGLTPKVSPGGDLAAVSVLDLGVQIVDATTGQAIDEAGLLEGLIESPAAEDELPAVAWPLAWLDDGLLAVAVVDGGSSTISWIDLGDPRRPVPGGPPLTVTGSAIDGSRAHDGRLAVLVRSGAGPAREVVIVEPAGEVVDRFGVTDGALALDYSPDGRFLLLVLERGGLEVLGDPEVLSALTGTYVDAGW